MIRLLIGVSLLATGTAFAQSPPAADFFPLHPKAKWVYRIGDQDVVAECAGSKRFGNEEAFELVITTGGKQTAKDWYVIKEDGVYRVRSKMNDFVPPIKILSIPARKGDSWKANSREGDNIMRGEYRITDDAAIVSTPAGQFRDCILVEGNVELAGSRTRLRIWFAPNVGIVRLTNIIQGAEVIVDLVSFTPGEAPGLPPRGESLPVPQVQPCPVLQPCCCTPPPPCRMTMRRHCRFFLLRARH